MIHKWPDSGVFRNLALGEPMLRNKVGKTILDRYVVDHGQPIVDRARRDDMAASGFIDGHNMAEIAATLKLHMSAIATLYKHTNLSVAAM